MLGKPVYKLRDWIPAESWDREQLQHWCHNPHPNAISLLEKHWNEIRVDKRCMENLLKNPSAGQMIETHWDEILEAPGSCAYPSCTCRIRNRCKCWYWKYLCSNPSAVQLLARYLDTAFPHLDWNMLSRNENVCLLLQTQKYQECQKNQKYVLPPSAREQRVWSDLDLQILSDSEDIHWSVLACNPNPAAIRLFEISWNEHDGCYWYSTIASLCENPNPSAVALIEKHWEEIEWDNMDENRFDYNGTTMSMCWSTLCANSNAIPLLDKLLHKFQDIVLNEHAWASLCGNPNAMHLVERHWDVIRARWDRWESQYSNSDFYGWENLCSNPSAIPFLEKHWHEFQPHIDWDALCCNPNAAELVEKHWDLISNHSKFSWSNMLNYLGYYEQSPPWHLLEKHWSDVKKKGTQTWSQVLASPTIFVLDLAAMRSQARPFAEELAAKVFHPRRVAAWEAAGIDVAEDL